jgi:heptosyltransferase-1
MQQPPKSILITLMGSLGDVTRALSLIAPLKLAFPDCRITWLVEPKCVGILKLAKQIDRIVIFRRGQGVRAFFEIINELKSENYDICFDLQRHFKSGLFSKLSGAKRIIGFHRRDAKEFNWLFSTETIEPAPDDLPKIRHYWKFLELIGIAAPASSNVEIDKINRELLFNKFNLDLSLPYVIFNLGSSWKSKDWSEVKYIELIEKFCSSRPDVQIVLSGSSSHADVSERVVANSKGRIINLCNKTSLEELVSLISYSALVFGPDSGPGHIASMLGVPFVGVFGPTDTNRTAPYGKDVELIVSDVKCRPCYRRSCPGLGQICMQLIQVERVLGAIHKRV